MSAPEFSTSSTNNPPGFASVTFKLNATATVTNTTSGQPNPESYVWSPFALYPIGSPVCTIGKGLLNNAPANQASAVLPGMTMRDGGAPTYCALQLANLSFGPSPSNASPAPLGPGEAKPMAAASSASTPGTIPHVPVASVNQLVAGLAQPAKVVYQVTPMLDGPQEQTPSGENCAAYLYLVPGQNNTSSPFLISVPAKYAGVCSK
jgi:hypothetical protein